MRKRWSRVVLAVAAAVPGVALTAPGAHAATAPVTVLSQNFGTSIGSGWSTGSIVTAPSGEKFLGDLGGHPFSTGGVSLNLASLPAHSMLTVQFDLYVLGSWEGNGPADGPDRWRVGIDGAGQADTTFSNRAGVAQSYPGAYPSSNPAQTGAINVGRLGWSRLHAGDPAFGDATYRFTLNVAHSASTGAVSFSSPALQGWQDEAWGLDNVTVKVGTPDLVETVTAAAGQVVPWGGKATITDTIGNVGNAPALASTTSYALSRDQVVGDDVALVATRTVSSLPAGTTRAATMSLAVPAVPPGDYYVVACADSTAAVVEQDDANNCAVTTTPVTVAMPDLGVTSLTTDVTTVPPGGSFTVTATSSDTGNAPAVASTTRLYLGTGTTHRSSDLTLSPDLAVPALTVGGTATASVPVTLPGSVAVGSYRVFACADAALVVRESAEGNNCRASDRAINVSYPSYVSAAMAPTTTTPVHRWVGLNQVDWSSMSTEQAAAVANNFDVAVVMPSRPGIVSAMKAANPQLTTLVYHNGAFSPRSDLPASWYAHDANGNRITSVGYNNYLMDVSNPQWAAQVVQDCITAEVRSGADGCHTDVLNTSPLFPGTVSAPPINPATGRVWTFAAYQGAVDALAAGVRDGAPGPEVANGVMRGARWYATQGGSSKPLTDYADGAVAEIWLHDRSVSPSVFPAATDWKNDVDMLVEAENEGRTLLAETKLWEGSVLPTPAEIAQWRSFSFASYLLATSGRSYFLYSPERTFASMTSDDPWTRTPVGTAVGTYRPQGDAYVRDYTDGFVAVNPGTADTTVALPPGSWQDLYGNVMTGSAVVGAHDGNVWVRVPDVTPKPTDSPTPTPTDTGTPAPTDTGTPSPMDSPAPTDAPSASPTDAVTPEPTLTTLLTPGP